MGVIVGGGRYFDVKPESFVKKVETGKGRGDLERRCTESVEVDVGGFPSGVDQVREDVGVTNRL